MTAGGSDAARPPDAAPGDTLVLEAPAKLNLVLEVLGRRDDGFHELATVFQALELADTLTLRRRARRGEVARGVPDVRLRLDGPERDGVPESADNLVVRAAAAVLRRASACDALGLDVRLTKQIPAGGGLGGGSSDAAVTARGVHALLGAPFAADELFALCAELGSDVPFFLLGGTALGLGRGERLRAVAAPRPFEATLLLPDYGVSTPRVYAALDAAPWDAADDAHDAHDAHDALPSGWDARLARLADADLDTLEVLFRNDLAEAACAVEPRLRALLARDGVHLSGSGSTAFLFGHVPAAEIATWRTQPMRVLHTRSRNR